MTLSEFQLTQLMMPDSELIELAEKQISKLAETGGRSHKMCVPPEITDTDMILSELLRRYKELSSRPAPELEGAEEVWNIAESILGRCKCDIAYASRRLTDPNCSWCEYHVDFIQSLHKFAAAKVEKVQSELEAARARISQLEELNERLQFMVDNGLGDKDMKNDL